MSTNNLRNGSKGDEVKGVQEGLRKLGYEVEPDGHFGPKTEEAVKSLQTLFGYTVDGIAGEGTQKLITSQIGYGWNLKLPNAKELAMQAQGKGTPAQAQTSGKAAPAMTPEQQKAAVVAKEAAMGAPASKGAAPASKGAAPASNANVAKK